MVMESPAPTYSDDSSPSPIVQPRSLLAGMEGGLPGPLVTERRERQPGSGLARQLWQLSNVRGNPPRLILCEQLGRYCKHLGTTNATRLFFRWGKSAWRRS